MSNCDERELAKRAPNGDTPAYGQLVQLYRTTVFNVCYRMMGERPEAEDMAQEAFVRAYQRLHTFDIAQPFGPWIRRVATKAWLQAEMASGIVRKIVSAAGAGAVGINIGNFEDWNSGIVSVDKALVPTIGASAFMGMIERTKTDAYAGGPLPYTQAEFSRINEAGESRPALHALSLVNWKLDSLSTVTKLDLGEGVWAYRVERASSPLWVLWYDGGTLILPNQNEPEVDVTIAFPADRALVTTTPTEVGQTVPATQTMSALAGGLTLTVGQTPLFLEIDGG